MKKQSESKSSFGHTAALLLGALAIASFGGMITFGMLYYTQQPANAEPAIPSGVNLKSWFDNGAGGAHLLKIMQGRAPTDGTQVSGTVLTDTNCDPDAQGLSHCHNIIDLGGGRRIEVVNTPFMSKHPCLSPGQQLTLTRLNADWVIAYEGKLRPKY
jgi:hypothetical protein